MAETGSAPPVVPVAPPACGFQHGSSNNSRHSGRRVLYVEPPTQNHSLEREPPSVTTWMKLCRGLIGTYVCGPGVGALEGKSICVV